MLKEYLKSIADNLRSTLLITEKINAQDFPDKVIDVYDSGYDAGQNFGYNTGIKHGKQAVWEAIQNNGKPANYYYAFAYNRFDDESYNPIYTILCSDGTTPSQSIFYGNTKITDTKVEIIASNSANACFYNMENCHTIRKFTVAETTTFTNAFYNCDNLVNIEFGGIIGKNISLTHSEKLSKASIESVVGALSLNVTGQTLTLNKNAVQNAFGTDYDSSTEWTTLKNSKSNWTITLS